MPAAASPPQRIALVAKPGDPASFVLTPLAPGPVARDFRNHDRLLLDASLCDARRQAIEINDPVKTFIGKRGTFVVRIRIEWTDAGNGSTIGSGSWKVVRGTRAYAHLTANGRLAVVAATQGGDITWRAEGVVR